METKLKRYREEFPVNLGMWRGKLKVERRAPDISSPLQSLQIRTQDLGMHNIEANLSSRGVLSQQTV